MLHLHYLWHIPGRDDLKSWWKYLKTRDVFRILGDVHEK